MATTFPSSNSPSDELPRAGLLTEEKRNEDLNPPSEEAANVARNFLIFSLVLLVACLISLVLPYWMYYCEASVGLTEIGAVGWTSSIRQVAKEICDPDYTENFCGHYCKKLRLLRDSGIAMTTLGSIAITALAIAWVRTLVLIFNPSKLYGEKVIRSLLVASAVLWVAGSLTCIGVFASITNEVDKTYPEGGIILAMFTSLWHIVNCFYGFSAVRGLRR